MRYSEKDSVISILLKLEFSLIYLLQAFKWNLPQFPLQFSTQIEHKLRIHFKVFNLISTNNNFKYFIYDLAFLKLERFKNLS